MLQRSFLQAFVPIQDTGKRTFMTNRLPIQCVLLSFKSGCGDGFYFPKSYFRYFRVSLKVRTKEKIHRKEM